MFTMKSFYDSCMFKICAIDKTAQKWIRSKAIIIVGKEQTDSTYVQQIVNAHIIMCIGNIA